MVNKNLTYQNASSLNRPLEEFIENIVKCVRENKANPICAGSDSLPVQCVPQCLLNKYCGPDVKQRLRNALPQPLTPLVSCTAKQKLLLGISALVIAMVREKYQSSQPS